MILLSCSINAASITCLSILGEEFPTVKNFFFFQYGKFSTQIKGMSITLTLESLNAAAHYLYLYILNGGTVVAAV